MSEFYLRTDSETLGPLSSKELHHRRIGPKELVRLGEEGKWMHLSTMITSDAEASSYLDDGVDPDAPGPEPWQQRSLVEHTWPAMLLGADGLWLLTAASMNESLSGWVTALSLVTVQLIAGLGLLRRQPWAWLLSALLFGASATWMLAPLIASPSANLAIWVLINLGAMILLILRRPRGAALDWPAAQRRLLLLFSADANTEARPLRYRTDRSGPVAAFVGAISFFVLVVASVSLYHALRYPEADIPISLIPRGADVWGRLAALGVYAFMVLIAVLFSLKGRSVMRSLGITAGQGWGRALWTGARIFLALFVILLASRWIMRTVEVVEQRLSGPAVSSPEDTATGQVRTAVQSALDRTRRPEGLSLRHLWLIIVALLVGPICEELFFRGLIFGSLRRKWPFWAAAAVSALIFAASHGWGSGWGIAGPILWLQITAGGLAAAYAYELTGTIAAPITMHVLWNGAQTMTQFIFD